MMLFFLLFFFLSGCKNETVINKEVNTFNTFPLVDTLVFNKVVEYEYGIPRAYYQIDSNLLIFDRSKSSRYYFYKYNLKSYTFSGTYLMRGRGPNESIGSWWAGIYKNDLWVYDITMRKLFISKIDYRKDTLDLKFVPAKNFDFRFDRMEYIDSTSIWVVGSRESSSKVSVISLITGEQIKEIGEFEGIQRGIPIAAFKDAYTTYIFRNHSLDKVLLLYRYTDVLEIIDINNESIKAIQGPDNIDVKYDVGRTSYDYYMRITEDTRRTCLNACVTDEYIYILYSGCFIGEESWIKGNIIHVFDWDGNPIKKLHLDRYIDMLFVTNDNKVLYSFDNNQSFIIKCNLN